ncbi:hypothetical protein FACS1894219_01780 [Clostridia bacterium]|nr:hypothetical protein FACS1894219_01780 [Clostridia bacterium]
MFIRIGKLRVHYAALLIAGVFLAINMSYYTLIVFASIALHESGHIAAITLMGQRVVTVEVLPFGVTIGTGGSMLSYRADVFVYLAGPAANIAAAFVIYCFISAVGYDMTAMFALITNLSYAALNLFPVKTLDGGRALRSLSYAILPERAAGSVAAVVSAAALVALSGAAMFVLMVTGYNFTLVFMCGYLFYTLHFSTVR